MEGGTHDASRRCVQADEMETPSSRPADTEAAPEQSVLSLAPSHALALRLASRGEGEREIASALDIPLEAVAPLLEIARAKLASLERHRS